MAREKRTPGEVIQMAADLILKAGVRGLTASTRPNLEEAARGAEPWRDWLSAGWERAWAVDADLSVRVGRGDGVRVEVTWATTGRTTSAARAAVALYTQVVDLACELEQVLGRFEIVDDRSGR